MNLDFIVKKTFQISERDFNSYCHDFNLIFDKKFSTDELKKKYCSGKDGYSIHSLLYNDKKEICAGFTLIPYTYIFNGKKITIALGCDAFVKKEYRSNEFILYKLYKNLAKEQLSNNIEFILSIPNPKATRYWEVLAKWKKIGQLKLRIFPLNLFNMKFIWKRIFYLFNNFLTSDNSFDVILNIDKSFVSNRFFGYKKYNNTYYKIYKEGKYSVLYIFCVDSISKDEKKNLFKHLYDNYNVDFISVCTNYEFKPLIRVPKFIINRDINVMIDNELDSFKPPFSKWALSLTNFDNR